MSEAYAGCVSFGIEHAAIKMLWYYSGCLQELAHI
jgi:hypothetical protein